MNQRYARFRRRLRRRLGGSEDLTGSALLFRVAVVVVSLACVAFGVFVALHGPDVRAG
ncbi:hypothetical protein ACIB24_21075 [Spongisporangium articulatum]|uniref:Uncharacterized protein n=1 Tax=Spongisporangium articulatum TaxID=3362603 RepID=A0ABW8AUL7_9ACTN